MRVLVTGASGFLGRAVVSSLLERGHAVRVLLRPTFGAADLPWASRVEVVRADLRSAADLVSAFDQVETVVHLAAQVGGDLTTQFQGTVLATERLFEALSGSSVRRLLLVSSISVYDWRAPDRALVEESLLERSVHTRDSYAITKIWQERLCRRYAEGSDLELVILRPGFIWGPSREWVDGVGTRLGKLVLVNGPMRRLPLTHVKNCADAIEASLTCEAAGGETFNVFDSDDVRAWRFASDYAKAMGGVLLPFPYHLGLVLAGLASGIARLLFGPKAKLPGILVLQRYRARFRSLRFRSLKLQRVVGWTPTRSYEESLRCTYGDAQSPTVAPHPVGAGLDLRPHSAKSRSANGRFRSKYRGARRQGS